MALRLGQAVRRKIIQCLALLLANREMGNLLTGRLYKGAEKQFCAPGLNCYSCPAATLSCPLGALQAVGGAAGFSFSFYASGFLLLVGAILGRAVCGFLCPFGLFQELLHCLPGGKWQFFAPLGYLKYVLLAVFVLLLPALWTDYAGVGAPAFCQYICPAGTLEAGLPLLAARPEFRQAAGNLFLWKCFLLALTILGSIKVYRFFCRAICPLGAIYGWLNRVSLYRVRVQPELCIACGKCQSACPMGLDPVHQSDSPECIRCGECEAACGQGALRCGFFSSGRCLEKPEAGKS